ncbi:MAG: RecX family transcriptional regulator [Lachnospiraceae bacterium]|nr:RecX family transcriptional regulator [Lachnospiraceae bacterium]
MERVVTAIELVKGGRKRKIYVNDEWAFSLYPAQIRGHGIEEGMVLTGELYERICTETLEPQAIKRVLNLLIAKDRSRKELLEKLAGDGYPPEVAQTAVEYAQSYHYVDDLRFAVTYLRSHEEEKSRLQLSMKLKERGIAREVVDEAFETVYEERLERMGEDFEEAELTALRRQVGRKVKNPATLTQKDVQKLTASLCAKGFRGADIRRVLGALFSGEIPENDIE